MVFSEPNWLAVVIAAVVNMVLGFLWYGPLFGKTWMQMSGITKKQIDEAKKKGMTASYILMLIGTLISVCVLGVLINATNSVGINGGFMVAILAWFGFVATVTLGSVLWEGKSWGLWILNNAYYLISYIISGAILASWP